MKLLLIALLFLSCKKEIDQPEADASYFEMRGDSWLMTQSGCNNHITDLTEWNSSGCITGVDRDGCTIYGNPSNPQTNHKPNCPNKQ